MTTKEVRNEVRHRLCYQPNWIDNTSSIDHFIWTRMTFINDYIIYLISDDVLGKRKVKNIVDNFEWEMTLILDNTDKYDLVYKHYEEIIGDLLIYTIEVELFETSANIRNFIEIKK